jgi:hypothetical protein
MAKRSVLGKPHSKRLSEEEIREAAAKLHKHGTRVGGDTLRVELGSGCLSFLHRVQREWRFERLEEMAAARLEGDLTDAFLVAKDGSRVVVQVPTVLPLNETIAQEIFAAEPGQPVRIGDALCWVNGAELEALKAVLQKVFKPTCKPA